MDAKKLIRKIENTGRDARSYSGRFMYGKRCVGVALERWDIGRDLPKKGHRLDSLGLGMIMYWPDATWPEEEMETA